MQTKAQPEPGRRYRHYKGDEYEVVAVGEDYVGIKVVIYRHVASGRWYTRPVTNFMGMVRRRPRADREPRFERVG